MTDSEKEEVVLSAAAIACGFATSEEIKQQRLLRRKDLERERWQLYLKRREVYDHERQRKFVRQQLRVANIISEEIDLDIPTEFNAAHKGFY